MRLRPDSPLPPRLASNPAAAALSYAYAAVVNMRNSAYDRIPALSLPLPRPVISIGGIRAGGVGKTPTAQLIGRYLIDNSKCSVAFLSRGYGRTSKKRTIIVGPRESVNWEDVGDEPWMLRNNIPESWLGICADRSSAARSLSPLIPDRSVFILDDGFQHRRARRDLNVVCLSESAFADRPLPAGYLREPVTSLVRSDLVFVIGAEERLDKLKEVKAGVDDYLNIGRGDGTDGDGGPADDSGTRKPAYKNLKKSARLSAILLQYPQHWVEARSGKISKKPPFRAPVAVTGIARPDRFLAMLRAQSVTPSSVRTYKDHHKFKINDIDPDHNIYLSGMVTTEKDAVRLLSPEFKSLGEIWYLKIGLRFADRRSETSVLSRISSIVP